MNKEQGLHPCWFCESEVIAVGRLAAPSHPHTPFQASCGACGAAGPEMHTERAAASAWNRAASPPAAGGVTEALQNTTQWLEAALNCKDWHWDWDQRVVASADLDTAKAVLAALAVGDEGIREGDLVTAVWELLRTVHQPTPKAGSDYWHVTAGKHVEFGKLITKLHSLLDFPTPPSRGEGV